MQKPRLGKSRYFARADSNGKRDKNDIEALESMEDYGDDVGSFNEVEGHTEHDDVNQSGDDADDEMFLDAPIGESLMDDVDAYLEEQEQQDQEDE